MKTAEQILKELGIEECGSGDLEYIVEEVYSHARRQALTEAKEMMPEEVVYDALQHLDMESFDTGWFSYRTEAISRLGEALSNLEGRGV